MKLNWAVAGVLACMLIPRFASADNYKYIRIGSKDDVHPTTSAGIAMMGGGTDLDEAFRWLCEKGNGGDFLILRAAGNDDYNAYVNGLCKTNSVATLVIPNRRAASDAAVAQIIRHAGAVFIAGGDQARYLNFWKGTGVQDAINQDVADGKPIGGTSAGLAVLGEFAYGALKDPAKGNDLQSAETLRDPFFKRVTLARGFLKVPHLENTITDSHFATRDRMGRSLVFLARLTQSGSGTIHEIAIDEKSAVLVDESGNGVVVGSGKGAYFLNPANPPEVCRKKTPLTFRNVGVYHGPTGAKFSLPQWEGDGGASYILSVIDGKVTSTQPGGGVY